LQLGARVELHVEDVGSDEAAGSNAVGAVSSWRVLEMPAGAVAPSSRAPEARSLSELLAAADAANRSANSILQKERKTSGTVLPLCNAWAAAAVSGTACHCSLACNFRHNFLDEQELSRAGETLRLRKSESAAAVATSLERQRTHGTESKQAKSSRVQVFVTWLLETFGAEALRGPTGSTGVLDIAGGKGLIAALLQDKYDIPSTLVDPLARKSSLRRRPGARQLQHVALAFDVNSPCSRFRAAHADLVEGASFLVAMHPDQVAAEVVDAALMLGLGFAVVPCCVFAHLYPERHLASGVPVREYSELLAFLCEKDSRIEVTELPFEGRNVAVFMRPPLLPREGL